MANQITVLLDPTQMPARTQDQTVFDNNMANLAANLPTLGAQMNLVAATMNAYSAGTAYSIPYTFDAATADADPGAGKIRFDNATQSGTTTLRLDLLGSNGIDYTTLVDSFDASTSIVKGAIRIEKAADPTKFIAFNVTGRAAPAGYRNVAVSYVGISSANPFANGDALVLKFQRTGDKGDPGVVTAFPMLHARDEKTSGTSGGAIVASTWTARTLNTVKKNSITGASVAGNQITLPAGTYRFRGRAPAFDANAHQAALYNVTDGGFAMVGSTSYSGPTTTPMSSDSDLAGEIILAAPKVFELRHWIANGTNGTNIGQPANTGQVEVYSEIIFEKVA
jgi:hypothetical protein